jgi:M6 family metalloprotease-like protein
LGHLRDKGDGRHIAGGKNGKLGRFDGEEGPVASHDEFDLTPGTDVGSIDDSSIPREVRDRIFAPSAKFMRAQLSVRTPFQKVVVIPVDFEAWPRNASVTTEAIREFMFGPLGTESVAAFFAATSYNHAGLLEGAISECVRLPADPPASELSGSNALLQAACQGASVDWSQFADANGVITQDRALLVVIPPFGGTGASRFHQFQFTIGNLTYTMYGYVASFDCKRPNDFANGNDALSYNRATACHELCHALYGLPDRYGTGVEHGGRDYVGDYDLMANNGSVKMLNPHDRLKLGWFEPRIHHLGRVPRRLYKFRAAENFTNSALIVYSDGSPDEYWILENRSLADDPWGVDAGFPKSGLAVWWVDMANDNVVLVRQEHPSEKPLNQSQPQAQPTASDTPLFDSASGAVEASLFPQNGTGMILLKQISAAGGVMTVEL